MRDEKQRIREGKDNKFMKRGIQINEREIEGEVEGLEEDRK